MCQQCVKSIQNFSSVMKMCVYCGVLCIWMCLGGMNRQTHSVSHYPLSLISTATSYTGPRTLHPLPFLPCCHGSICYGNSSQPPYCPSYQQAPPTAFPLHHGHQHSRQKHSHQQWRNNRHDICSRGEGGG